MANAPFLAAWAVFIEAFVAMRRKEHDRAWRLLDEADRRDPPDPMRHAAVLHLRGTLRFHQGDDRGALALLNESRAALDDGHFGMARVLDTMGMVYGSQGNFHAAQAFYDRSITLKRARADVAGEALTRGQLGRLYLEWGLLDAAERHFKDDLRLAKWGEDLRGEAQMYNALGQVALARGDWAKAAEWLDSCIARCRGMAGWEVLEGYARKDRALAYLAAGTEAGAAKAEDQLKSADARFNALTQPFAEGLAHAARAWGVLYRLRKDWGLSLQRLRDALLHFQRHGEGPEIARTQLELALTYRAMGEVGEPAVEALRDALATAEAAAGRRSCGWSSGSWRPRTRRPTTAASTSGRGGGGWTPTPRA